MKRLAMLAALAMAACSGGSGANAVIVSPTGAATTSNATFIMTIPPASASTTALSDSRKPLNFSAATASVTIAEGGQTLKTADVAASSSLCTSTAGGGRTCSILIDAPVGTDIFTLTAYDGPNGSGTILCSGTVAAAILAAAMTTVNVAVTGVTSKLSVALQNAYPPAGTAASTAVVVEALDADGNVILGNYAQPATLSDSDASGVTSLSSTSVTGSSSGVTLAYTGASFTQAKITASMPGVSAASVTFAPTPSYGARYFVPEVAIGGIPQGFGLGDMCLGPDGNMWVLGESTSAVLKVTPTGTVTDYLLASSGDYLEGIAVGSDGNLWFAEYQNGAIGRITTSGTITEFKVPTTTVSGPSTVTLGPDGNIWFPDQFQAAVGKITPNGTITMYPLPANSDVSGIAKGPDGNLWMTDDNSNAIVVVSTSGNVVATYPVPTPNAALLGITAGPDGNMWFAESGKIGRITMSGQITEFSTPTAAPNVTDVVSGPDGNIWFSEMGKTLNSPGAVGYITPDGSTIREFVNPTGEHVHGLAFDTKDTLWWSALSAPIPVFNYVGTLIY